MRAIVTGGAGFIGSHVVDALVARGDEVLVLDDLSRGKRDNVDPSVTLVRADVRDAEAVSSAFRDLRPDVCFHLAAQPDVRVSVERPDFDCEVNVVGTIRVLESARAHGGRVVFASTGGAIYGECERPATEDAPRLPLAPYGASKLAAEEYLGTYNRLYGARHSVLRYGNVYGPRQDPHGEAGVVAIFLGHLVRGEPPTVFGDGSQTRDYVFAGDVARATLAAATRDSGTFNVGTGRETSVLELLDACSRASGVHVEPRLAPARLGELGRSALDPSRAKAGLGFIAGTSLDDGLASTWRSLSPGGVDAAGAN